ncbi:MAG: phosphatidylglycerophosphatase A [Nitrospirota bacterium]
MNTVCKYIATLGFIGYIPFAPGTFGTFAAFLFYVLIRPSVTLHIFVLSVIIPLGILTSHRAEHALNQKDSRHIVIDEFCGFLLAVLFIPFSMHYAVSAFFLFRVFDILKPFPIKRLESFFRGGVGIMADDALAALYANAVLQTWKMLF